MGTGLSLASCDCSGVIRAILYSLCYLSIYMFNINMVKRFNHLHSIEIGYVLYFNCMLNGTVWLITLL